MFQFSSSWLWILIIPILILAIIWLLHTNVKLKFTFTQINNYSRLRVGVTAINKIINIGMKSLFQTGNDVTSNKLIDESEQGLSMPSVTEAIQLMKMLKRKHFSKLSCEKFTWDTQIGLNDPMGSAMLCGLLWAIKSFLLGIVSSHIKLVHNPKMTVAPLYNHIHINSEVNGVIILKLKDAVWISVILIWYVSKSRRKKKRQKKKTSLVVN